MLTAVVTLLAGGFTLAGAAPSEAVEPGRLWFDDARGDTVRVVGQRFVDGHGRTVVLRGFNVSGKAKLAEYGGLPFANVADADRAAAQMRRQTGANAVRFLITWAATEPTPGRLDTAYLKKVTDYLRVFTNRGFQVYLDFHQDLHSRYLFNPDSWYTGDGAPEWIVKAGHYPKENCGICFQWGQNMLQNPAVQQATYDFWHNRVVQTPIGAVGVQDAFLRQAEATMRYLRQHLSDEEFAQIVGFDPLNEPVVGRYDAGQDGFAWERHLLWPFYLKFRQRMDAAGWADKPAFVQPNLFWNANFGPVKQPGGFTNVGALGNRFVFNTHFYDQLALSGVFMWGKAGDGQYSNDLATVRKRAAALGTAAVVSEFGSPVTGYTSDKSPTVLKALYQAMDSAVSGARWWSKPASSGSVLSGTQWQWDIYNGAHHELMNGNPQKVQTEADGWNGEDFSVVRTGDAGDAVLRLDARVLDRLYPSAVAGTPLAFTYEDRSRDGAMVMTWNPVPASLPNLRTVVGAGQYGVLVWRSGGDGAPTELHLPAAFTPAVTTVISDLGSRTGVPTYTARARVADEPIAVAPLPGGAGGQRLILSAPAAAGTLHYALVTNGAAQVSDVVRTAAQRELARWAEAAFS